MHIAVISHREHQAHAHFPRPAFQGHPFGLALEGLQRDTIREFREAGMNNIGQTDLGQHMYEARGLWITKGMKSESWHESTVNGPSSISMTK